MDTVMYWEVAVHSIVICEGWTLGARLTGNCAESVHIGYREI